MTLDQLLAAIPSTEPASFSEFISALGGDKPERGDTQAWRTLFLLVQDGEDEGLITVIRDDNDKISAVQLTRRGVQRVRRTDRPRVNGHSLPARSGMTVTALIEELYDRDEQEVLTVVQVGTGAVVVIVPIAGRR